MYEVVQETLRPMASLHHPMLHSDVKDVNVFFSNPFSLGKVWKRPLYMSQKDKLCKVSDADKA